MKLRYLAVLTLACSALFGNARAQTHQQQQAQQAHHAEQNRLGREMLQQQNDAYWEANGPAILAAEQARRDRRAQALDNDNAGRVTDWWGAISINLRTGSFGQAIAHRSGAQATAGVKTVCPDKDCALIALFRNTCVSSARNAKGSLYWADALKAGDASSAALRKCQANPASGNTCKAQDQAVCSGYAYAKNDGKLSNFNRGGLLGVIAPKLARIPDLAGPEAIFNPFLVQFTAQSDEIKHGNLTTALAAGQGKVPPLWGAVATGTQDGAIGLGMGITKAIAERDALAKCGSGTCQSKFSFEGDACVVMGAAKNAAGNDVSFIDSVKQKSDAQPKVDFECKKHGAHDCKLAFVECLDLTP